MREYKSQFSDEQFDTALDLWDSGFDTVEIAENLAVSEALVYNELSQCFDDIRPEMRAESKMETVGALQ